MMFTSLACFNIKGDNVSSNLSEHQCLVHRKYSISGRWWWAYTHSGGDWEMSETSFLSVLHSPNFHCSHPPAQGRHVPSSTTSFSAKESLLVSDSLHQSVAPNRLTSQLSYCPPYPTERPLSYCRFFSLWQEAWPKLPVISFRLTYIHFTSALDSLCFVKQNTLNGTFSWWLRVMSMNTSYCSILHSYKNHWSI